MDWGILSLVQVPGEARGVFESTVCHHGQRPLSAAAAAQLRRSFFAFYMLGGRPQVSSTGVQNLVPFAPLLAELCHFSEIAELPHA